MPLRRKAAFQNNSDAHSKAEGQEKAVHKYQAHPLSSRAEKAIDLREQ